MADSMGFLRIVSPQELAQQEQAQAAMLNVSEEVTLTDLANHIVNQFRNAQRHRTSSGEDERLLEALRTYRGQYSPQKLAEIAAFKGSQVYARMTTVKCRAATAILRDIYASNPGFWELSPSPHPEVPEPAVAAVLKLVEAEATTLAVGTGEAPPPDQLAQRMRQLMEAALQAEKKQAEEAAKRDTEYLDDVLTEGGFYEALNECLIDLPIFDLAIMKGPVVKQVQQARWENGQITTVASPKFFWERVSPFDLYFSPGATRVKQASTFEVIRFTRAELQTLVDLPAEFGFSSERISSVLENPLYGTRYSQWQGGERSTLERRENPVLDSNQEFLEGLEFNGFVRGKFLKEWGVDVPDEKMDYFATCWMVNDVVIKAMILKTPDPRPPYYITSFEKVPGSIYGHGLPDILSDLQEVTNATLRALVNNLSIASGPQVVINTDRTVPGADVENLYPWKRWFIVADPLAVSGEKPIDFYQPNSNASELLAVYKEFTNVADEVSAIPRYLTGSQRTGGAAATASGLSMLMANSGKVMQNVASNIDNDMLRPVVMDLYQRVMQSVPGQLRGDSFVTVKGVTNAMKREQDRVRQLEFLGLTANQIDAPLLGAKGRAAVLRAVAEGLGLDHEVVVDATAVEAQNQGGPGMAPLPAPNEGKSSGATPRLDLVSNMSTT